MVKAVASYSEPPNRGKDSALILSPDGYSRFFVIVRLIEEIYKNSNKLLHILDVGGCSPYLYEHLIDSKVQFELTIVDILPQPSNINVAYIQEDITQSKLKDNSFDIVLSTDVLEHIPKDSKDLFVRSCVRLSKDLVILAAPFDTPGVDTAEHMVNAFNKQLFKVGQDWLEEHFSYGKPKIDRTEHILDELKFPYEHFGTNNLYSWIISTHLTLINGKLGTNQAKHTQINLEYNQHLSRGVEFNEPTYRHFFVVYKQKQLAGKKVLETLTGHPDPQVFSLYLHNMFKLLTERMTDLKHESETNLHKVEKLELQLHNEKIHSNKLNALLIEQTGELERLIPLRKLMQLRNPVHLIKRKMRGSK